MFGGDNWAREAQHRKRRLDDVLVEGLHASAYKKLSNGKYACLVCPHNPIIDSLLMFSMHCKGSRHCKAESKLKERELVRQDEINKRIAFSDCSTATSNSIKPLVEHTRKATSDILPNITCQQSSESSNCDLELAREHALNVAASSMRNSSFPQTVASEKVVTERVLDFRERREIELKFIAAGWKRDCNGKWYKDENVEFDSDEEDPNVCLA